MEAIKEEETEQATEVGADDDNTNGLVKSEMGQQPFGARATEKRD